MATSVSFPIGSIPAFAAARRTGSPLSRRSVGLRPLSCAFLAPFRLGAASCTTPSQGQVSRYGTKDTELESDTLHSGYTETESDVIQKETPKLFLTEESREQWFKTIFKARLGPVSGKLSEVLHEFTYAKVTLGIILVMLAVLILLVSGLTPEHGSMLAQVIAGASRLVKSS